MIKNNSQEILDAIKLTLNSRGKKEPINLHEPYFEDTNAMKYLKDCL